MQQWYDFMARECSNRSSAWWTHKFWLLAPVGLQSIVKRQNLGRQRNKDDFQPGVSSYFANLCEIMNRWVAEMGWCGLTMTPQCNFPLVCPDLLARRDQLMIDVCLSLMGLIPNSLNFYSPPEMIIPHPPKTYLIKYWLYGPNRLFDHSFWFGIS